MAQKKTVSKAEKSHRIASNKKRRRRSKRADTADLANNLHRLFQQQAEVIIAESDASDDEKSQMLLALNCPCCGLGGSSFSIKLKSQPRPSRQRRFFSDGG